MVWFNARFDGKVIVPETPLNLPANQRVRINLEPIDTGHRAPATKHLDLSKLRDLMLSPPNPRPRFADDDALWKGSAGEDLINDPRRKK